MKLASSFPVNLIHNEDCVSGVAKLPDACVDLVVTSPPYDRLRLFEGYTDSFDFEATLGQLARVVKPGGVVVWNVQDQVAEEIGLTQTSFRQALAFTSAGFRHHQTLIWHKDMFRYADRSRYRADFEYLFVFSKGKPKVINLIKDRPNRSTGRLLRSPDELRPNGKIKRVKKTFICPPFGTRSSVWRIYPDMGGASKSNHPAKFPLQLAEDVIRSYSRTGDIVLDPFMGSGTVALAAAKWGRRYVGYEVNPNYWREAVCRVG